MFKNKVYNRFKKIYDYLYHFDDDTNEYSVAKIFKTKLGKREVRMCELHNKTLAFIYLDYDYSCLFALTVNTKGRIKILRSSVDDVAIFSAIYEIECLIHDTKISNREKVLEKMFLYYAPMTGCCCNFDFKGK